jgi:hypothetical protein
VVGGGPGEGYTGGAIGPRGGPGEGGENAFVKGMDDGVFSMFCYRI